MASTSASLTGENAFLVTPYELCHVVFPFCVGYRGRVTKVRLAVEILVWYRVWPKPKGGNVYDLTIPLFAVLACLAVVEVPLLWLRWALRKRGDQETVHHAVVIASGESPELEAPAPA